MRAAIIALCSFERNLLSHERPLVALCVIGGAPPNFRSRSSSRRTEAAASTGEDDPLATFVNRW
jgi:hypothetical protein